MIWVCVHLLLSNPHLRQMQQPFHRLLLLPPFLRHQRPNPKSLRSLWVNLKRSQQYRPCRHLPNQTPLNITR